MNQGQPNASSATGTRNRVPDPAPYSGICSVCLDGCPGPEVIYPQPFGKVTGIPYVMESDMEDAKKILFG